jgi:ATP-dependent DNA helicase RecQ
VEEKKFCDRKTLMVSSIVNKSSLKVSVIQSIDRKVPLDVIAESKGLEMNEVLKEIESIVNSGTKLNIDYFINEMMDEDHQDTIYTYFKEEAQSESVEEALDGTGRKRIYRGGYPFDPYQVYF